MFTSAYNANGNRTSLSATRGGTNDFLNSYTYDNLNRLIRVDQTGNGGATVANKRADFAYNAVGQFTSIARQVKPSSTWNEVATSTYTYDTLNRLTALDHKIGSTDIANYDWTYDAMDRVTQLSNGDGTSDYTYDKESELTTTDHSFQTDESYTYDATGNRTNGSYSVGTNNRMTSDGTYNYSYDDEGNRLTRTKISDSSLTEYTWDHRNRLTKVVERATGAGGAITKQTDYKYDIFDRRISKSYDADGAGAGSAVVSRYVYDGYNIALQFDGSNNLTHRYLHGPAVDQILADENASNSILWPLTDNLGTVRDLVNDSGTVQNHLKYDSFGKVTSESNAAVNHLFAYTGRERDEETGLQYHRARYYDPANGRWISHDPKGFTAGDSILSRYVANNVTNLTDANGLEALPNSFGFIPAPYSQDAAGYAAWYKEYLETGAPAPVPVPVPVGGVIEFTYLDIPPADRERGPYTPDPPPRIPPGPPPIPPFRIPRDTPPPDLRRPWERSPTDPEFRWPPPPIPASVPRWPPRRSVPPPPGQPQQPIPDRWPGPYYPPSRPPSWPREMPWPPPIAYLPPNSRLPSISGATVAVRTAIEPPDGCYIPFPSIRTPSPVPPEA